MYSDRLLQYFRSPMNTGELPLPAKKVEVVNPACGDLMQLSVLFDNVGRVAEARYRTRGCTASIAAGSALTVWMRGRTRSELALLDASTIAEELGGLPPASQHAAILCVDAVAALLAQK